VTAAVLSIEDAFDRYLDAVRGGRRRIAFDVVDEARAAGHGLRALYLEVFQPTLREIGRLWQENVLTVAQEHLATAITEWAMLRVFESSEPGRSVGRSLLAACTENERHHIGLRMLCDFMEIEGWDADFLGASVPTASLVRMVAERRPDVLALSASTAPQLTHLRGAIAQVRALPGSAPLVLVGGRPFLEDPALGDVVGADLVARDPDEAARMLAQRMA
jgi:methanogenic corrinoid protein MtbC1